jgi:hypothetical protein
VIALACEWPNAYGYPMIHWSSKELAAEAIKQGGQMSLLSAGEPLFPTAVSEKA